MRYGAELQKTGSSTEREGIDAETSSVLATNTLDALRVAEDVSTATISGVVEAADGSPITSGVSASAQDAASEFSGAHYFASPGEDGS